MVLIRSRLATLAVPMHVHRQVAIQAIAYIVGE